MVASGNLGSQNFFLKWQRHLVDIRVTRGLAHSSLDGADVTCCLTVKFQNPCWSGPSNFSSWRVISLSLEDIRNSFPLKTTLLIYRPWTKVTSWKGWKGVPLSVFLKVLCFLFMEWFILLLNLSNTSHSQKPPNIHASDGWSRFLVFHFIRYSQFCCYLWAHWQQFILRLLI